MSNPSLKQAILCVDQQKSFIVEAGAGSGKTWTLIESLKYILKNKTASFLKNNQRIACITYTNVAKDEISERIEYNPIVVVSTIHEFLWSVIQPYQRELKRTIIDLNEEDTRKKIENLAESISNVTIEYSQYGRNYEEGKIFHDDVLKLASILFSKYQKLVKLVQNKYPIIFIDEYQDTEPLVVKLLLQHLLNNNHNFNPADSLTLGFFGDSMQKIYNQGVGNIEHSSLQVITKTENYRCSKAVIALLNKIRPELQQEPAGKNLEGSVFFFHCNNSNQLQEGNFNKVVEYLGWPSSGLTTKILLLTHKGIASKLNYSNLIGVYDKLGQFSKDRLINKDDAYARLLFDKVEFLCALYKTKEYGALIDLFGKERYRIQSHSDKLKLKALIEGLNTERETKTVGDVLRYVYENGLFQKPKDVEEFELKISGNDLDENLLKKKEFFYGLMGVSYQEVMALHKFIEEKTPFSTKHGVKGAEFDNVLVVIDDASWNQYNFNILFSGQTHKPQYERSRNLFYMCCSRAKDRLAVLALSEFTSTSLDTAKLWFGEENVYDVGLI